MRSSLRNPGHRMPRSGTCGDSDLTLRAHPLLVTAALPFTHAAPDAKAFVVFDRPVQALLSDGAVGADPLGFLSGASLAWEECFRVCLCTERLAPPGWSDVDLEPLHQRRQPVFSCTAVSSVYKTTHSDPPVPSVFTHFYYSHCRGLLSTPKCLQAQLSDTLRDPYRPKRSCGWGVRLYCDWFKHASAPSRFFPPE